MPADVEASATERGGSIRGVVRCSFLGAGACTRGAPGDDNPWTLTFVLCWDEVGFVLHRRCRADRLWRSIARLKPLCGRGRGFKGGIDLDVANNGDLDPGPRACAAEPSSVLRFRQAIHAPFRDDPAISPAASSRVMPK